MGDAKTVAQKDDIEEGKGISVDVEGKKLAVFNIEGEYFAIDDECSHAGGSLSEGEVNGHTVRCPLHGAEFDLKTGQVLSEPAEEAVSGYKVIIDGDNVLVEI